MIRQHEIDGRSSHWRIAKTIPQHRRPSQRQQQTVPLRRYRDGSVFGFFHAVAVFS